MKTTISIPGIAAPCLQMSITPSRAEKSDDENAAAALATPGIAALAHHKHHYKDGSKPGFDVDACEAAVMRETGSAQVRILRTEFPEANNAFIVGVGPNAAPWQCLISGGIVAGVMSMTDEGSL